jgi:hypothetical protein
LFLVLNFTLPRNSSRSSARVFSGLPTVKSQQQDDQATLYPAKQLPPQSNTATARDSWQRKNNKMTLRPFRQASTEDPPGEQRQYLQSMHTNKVRDAQIAMVDV